MTENFDDVKRLREAYEAALDEADDQRARYHEAIRKLYMSGLSLSQIAENLGISRQRVHEIVGKDASVRRRNRKRTIGSVGIIIAIGASIFGVWLGVSRSADARSPFTSPKQCDEPCSWPLYEAVYERTDGKIFAIVGHKTTVIGSTTLGSSGGPVNIAQGISKDEGIRLATLVMRRDSTAPNLRSQLTAPMALGFADVTKDPQLKPAVRGNLGDFRLSSGKITRTGRRLVITLILIGIGVLGIGALTAFNVRATRRPLLDTSGRS